MRGNGLCCLFGSLLVGLSKTGIAGAQGHLYSRHICQCPSGTGIHGVLLLLLICGDLDPAVPLYRRHAVWAHLWKFCPLDAWPGSLRHGPVAGYKAFQRMIGGDSAGHGGGSRLEAAELARDPVRTNESMVPHRMWFAALMGTMAGFTTMVANEWHRS